MSEKDEEGFDAIMSGIEHPLGTAILSLLVHFSYFTRSVAVHDWRCLGRSEILARFTARSIASPAVPDALVFDEWQHRS